MLDQKTIITSPFGQRTNPVTGKISYHNGIDFNAKHGDNLISICDGKVVFSQFHGPFGYTIGIEDGKRIYYYCHCEPKNMPVVGNVVQKGDIIGKVGPKYIDQGPIKDFSGRATNGFTTGPHLHFSVKENGKYINPREIFEGGILEKYVSNLASF